MKERKGFFVLFLSLIVLVTLVFAAHPAEGGPWQGPEAPKIEIDEKLLDLGEIRQGDTATRTLKVKNTGNADLIIAKIRTGCPCIKAEISRSSIPPSQEAALKVTYFSAGKKPGKDSGRILIFANDPGSSVTGINVRLRVVAEAAEAAVKREFPDIPQISSDELYSRMLNKEKTALLDVREKNEYVERHIAGAIWFPKSAFDKGETAAGKTLEGLGRNAFIVVYCGAGHRSGYVTRKLREKGYNAFNLDGITFWEKKYPVSRGPKLPPSREPCTIRLEEAYEHYFKLFKNVVWLDVREPPDFAEGRIEGAVNIPLTEIELRRSEIPEDKEIVIYCEGTWKGGKCESALSAGRILLEHGYKQGLIKVFEDGYNAWKDAGYPVAAGLPRGTT